MGKKSASKNGAQPVIEIADDKIDVENAEIVDPNTLNADGIIINDGFSVIDPICLTPTVAVSDTAPLEFCETTKVLAGEAPMNDVWKGPNDEADTKEKSKSKKKKKRRKSRK